MTNTKKHALFSSVVALMLCCAMLIGTTFAWFTDSVTSSNNVINAGNLDIELYHKDPVKGGEYEAVGAESLFDKDVLWEPGHVEVESLKIQNLGTLNLKYQFKVNVVSESGSVNEAGQEFMLSDHLKFAVIDGEFTGNREAAVAAAEANAVKVNGLNWTIPGTMAPNADKEVTLVVWMPETVGNEANYRGDKIPTITLGINLFATQVENESDTFGMDYDGGAPWVTAATIDWYLADPDAEVFVLTSAEDLAGLAALTNGTATADMATYSTEPAAIAADFAGKTVKLGNNIDLAGHEWVPIGDPMSDGYVGFHGTFDGQGHTISNLYINNSAAWGQGLFGYNTNKGTVVKNFTVNNASVTGEDTSAVVVGWAQTGTFSNIKVTGNVKVRGAQYVAGIAGHAYYANIDNCSVIANAGSSITATKGSFAGGIAGYHGEGNFIFSKCSVENLTITGYGAVGGLFGLCNFGTTISGSSVKNVTLNKTRADGNPSIGAVIGNWEYNANQPITFSGVTVENVTLNGTHVPYDAFNVLYGSEYSGIVNTNFDLKDVTQSNVINNLSTVLTVKDVASLKQALATGGDYAVSADFALSETVNVPNGVNVSLDLNGKTISGTMTGTGNQDLFLVKGNLTVKNGTIELSATQNQGWNAMSSVFDITAGGAVNVKNATVKNLGGTDMNFVAHLNNWGTATLNVENSTLSATYIPVRVFNSGYDMNNVTIKNSTLDGGNHAFWVHNYTADLANVSKDVIDARLNLDIYGNNNTFKYGSSKFAPVRFGMSSSIFFNELGEEVVAPVAG